MYETVRWRRTYITIAIPKIPSNATDYIYKWTALIFTFSLSCSRPLTVPARTREITGLSLFRIIGFVFVPHPIRRRRWRLPPSSSADTPVPAATPSWGRRIRWCWPTPLTWVILATSNGPPPRSSLSFVRRTVAERTPPGQRQSVQHEGCHSRSLSPPLY